MSSRYGVSCFFLLMVIFLLAYKNYEIWFRPPGWNPPREMTKKLEVKSEGSVGMTAYKETLPHTSLLVIAEKNIFNPERKEFPVPSGGQAKPAARPQIILSGVMIAEDYQIASILIPGRPLAKGEREVKTLKLGDHLGEYKLTRISPDRITLETNGESFEVLLYDPNLPKKRVVLRTPAKPAEATRPLPSSPTVPAPSPTTPRLSPQGIPILPGPPKEGSIERSPPETVGPVPALDPETRKGRVPPRPSVPVEGGGK